MTAAPVSSPSGAPPHTPARLTPGQTVGWALAFVTVAGLIVLYFLYDTAARPLFGSVAGGAPWPLS